MSGQAPTPVEQLIQTFRRAAERVPAYRTLLHECDIRPESVKSIGDFSKLPVLGKHNTFQQFPLHELCLDGDVGPLDTVLTSSGHSGVFAFGLSDPQGAKAQTQGLDDILDAIFQVRSRSTLIVSCLPMGVKVCSECCTVGETSVRPDMALGLIEGFHSYFDQIILVGETAFIKHLLELGIDRGVDWKRILVHGVLGEEIVPENGRKYIEGILGARTGDLESGLIVSSMGIGELGLNLFFEAPPGLPIIGLRRALHENPPLRRAVLGDDVAMTPSIFTYLGDWIYVEFLDGQLVVTTLDPTRRIPMIRYAPGDVGCFVELSPSVGEALESAGVRYDVLQQLPLVAIQGRGKHVVAAGERIFPEQIKEGIYHHPELAKLTTANFRLSSGEPRAKLRLQLAPGIEPASEIDASFAEAISQYAAGPLDLSCEPYRGFESGMSLNYERKFDYLGS